MHRQYADSITIKGKMNTPEPNLRTKVKLWLLDKFELTSGHHFIAQFFCFLLMLVFFLLIQQDAFDQAIVRYFYLVEVGVVVIAVPLMTVTLRDKLKELVADDAKLRIRVTKEKRAAEVFAAFAIIAFFFSFYRVGVEFDRANGPARRSHLYRANGILMKAASCSPTIDVELPCRKIHEDFRGILDAMTMKNEGLIQSQINDLARLAPTIEPLKAGQLRQLSYEMDNVKIQDDSTVPTFFATGLLLLFSSMAISRKIAIASFDAWKAEHDAARKQANG
jgi:hypothetical protein